MTQPTPSAPPITADISLFDILRTNPVYNRKNSVAWFMNNIRNMVGSIGPMGFLGQNLKHQVKTPQIGKMYAFTYDPKTKEKLKYYDNFPLTMFFSLDGKYMTGINFHYLMPKTRLVLLHKLYEVTSDDRMDSKTIALVSWNLLKNASRYPEVGPAIKKYLIGQVKSRFVEIPASDWPIAVFLPTERFKKAPMETVWADSAKKIGT